MVKKIDIKCKKDQEHLPRIVAFSGGRSSGMMLLQMLRQGLLYPERGDVVIFNNTSTEHIKTYKFVEKIAEITESYAIPFFITEFDTYECDYNGRKSRKFTYRLAKHQNGIQGGYSIDGSIFEHSISWNRFLPNRHSRVCTAYLKGEVTRMFKEDWLSNKLFLEHLGPKSSIPSITKEDLRVNYDRFNKGSISFDKYTELSKYSYSQSANREKQYYSDFSKNGKVRLDFCDKKHIDILGIRSDESKRISKIKEKRDNVALPLVESGVTKNDVIEFWKNEDFNLDLPDSGMWSNCVFCPIKSWETLKSIQRHNEMINKDCEVNPPSKIEWWIDIENKYKRKTAKGSTSSFFGVQNLKKKNETYEIIKKESEIDEQNSFIETEYISCECGD